MASSLVFSVLALLVSFLAGWIAFLPLRGMTFYTLTQAVVLSLIFLAILAVGLRVASILADYGGLNWRPVLLSSAVGFSIPHLRERWRRRRAR